VKLWDVASGQERATLKGHAAGVSSVAFSPDGKTLATGSADNTVRLWRAATEREVLARIKMENQEHLANMNDERPMPRGFTLLPPGWFPTGSNPEEFEMGIDRMVSHAGKAGAYIKSRVDQPAGGTLMQMFRADDYRGKRLRMSAFVRTQEVRIGAQLWMRIDGENRSLVMDNMDNRPITGSSGWTKHEIVLDVPQDSVMIAFGILLIGRGQAWVDDFMFEEVGKDVATTREIRLPTEGGGHTQSASRYPMRPGNLDFEAGIR
jgi:hypothetical protein